MINTYRPEGMLSGTHENAEYLSSLDSIERAMNDGKILESTVLLCDSKLRLHLDLGGIKGIIDKDEAVYCREGETPKDIAIITRVGKPVCFKVIGIYYEAGRPIARLSRRAAQLECIERYVSRLCEGMSPVCGHPHQDRQRLCLPRRTGNQHMGSSSLQ